MADKKPTDEQVEEAVRTLHSLAGVIGHHDLDCNCENCLLADSASQIVYWDVEDDP